MAKQGKGRYEPRLIRGEDTAYDSFRVKAFEAMLEMRKVEVELAQTEVRYWREGMWKETAEEFGEIRKRQRAYRQHMNRYVNLAKARAKLVLAERQEAEGESNDAAEN